jgi:hypothetical protein
MQRAVFLLILALLPGEALATVRYSSMSMLCEDIRSGIRSEGDAIVRYATKRTPSMELYERFVRDSRYCEYGERVKTTYIPAADTDSCRVFHCVPVDRDRGGPLVILPQQ